MLHLKAGVDFEEIEVAFAEDELDGACVDVTRRGRGSDRGIAHRGPDVRRQGGRRSLLHDLLVAPLDRAFALAEMRCVAVTVTYHLDLDVPRIAHIPFEVDRRIAERRTRGLGGALDRRRELLFRFDDFHPDAPAAARRFQHHRKADLARGLERRPGLDCAAAWRDRHAVLRGELAGGELGSERAHGRSGWTDELDAGRLAGVRERRLLGQESVARMDGIRATVVRDLDDSVQLQIGLGRRRAPDVVRLIGVADVDRAAVGVRVDGGGCDPELATCTHDADGDLAPVRDQYLVEEFFLQPIASRGWFGLTTSPSLT